MCNYLHGSVRHVLQVLTALAARRNSKALSELPKRYGLRLPGREDCLLEPGYAPSSKPGPGALGPFTQSCVCIRHSFHGHCRRHSLLVSRLIGPKGGRLFIFGRGLCCLGASHERVHQASGGSFPQEMPSSLLRIDLSHCKSSSGILVSVSG